MHDRIEKTPEATGAGLIPIGLAVLIRPAKIRTESINSSNIDPVFPFGIHTITMSAWNPKELHRFWRRMLGMDGK